MKITRDQYLAHCISSCDQQNAFLRECVNSMGSKDVGEFCRLMVEELDEVETDEDELSEFILRLAFCKFTELMMGHPQVGNTSDNPPA